MVDAAIQKQVDDLSKYEAGFVTDIESDKAPKGLNEDIIHFISKKKNEPQWLLDFRLKAFEHWKKMPEPQWAKVHHPPIDYQDAYYYSAPKPKLNSMDEVDPELLRPLKNWACRCGNVRLWLGLRSMLCSIPYPLPQVLKKIWRRLELYFVRFPKPFKNILILYKNIWGQLFRIMTINMRV
jgi:hypothetical protein